MTLEEKLTRFKKNEAEKTEHDWELYKKNWISSISELQNTIIYKWFDDFFEKKLMEFSLVPVSIIEPYLGKYLTTSLEIALPNNKTFVLQPIAGITTDYDGKLEFSMLGNVYKRVSILRLLSGNKPNKWIIATSYDLKDQTELNKDELEKLMNEWLF